MCAQLHFRLVPKVFWPPAMHSIYAVMNLAITVERGVGGVPSCALLAFPRLIVCRLRGIIRSTALLLQYLSSSVERYGHRGISSLSGGGWTNAMTGWWCSGKVRLRGSAG